jgi:hypothetical protein
VAKEDFQYDSTSSVFRREGGLSRFVRSSTSRRQLLFEAGLIVLWAAALMVVASLFLW